MGALLWVVGRVGNATGVMVGWRVEGTAVDTGTVVEGGSDDGIADG